MYLRSSSTLNMNKTTIGIGLFVVIIIALLAFSGGPRAQLLSGASFVETYQETPSAVLLDVRTPSEFAAGHIDGAMNIDFENSSFASEIKKLDKAAPYFVYCRSGNRSGQAISIMKKEGIGNIYELSGGIISIGGSVQLVPSANDNLSD